MKKFIFALLLVTLLPISASATTRKVGENADDCGGVGTCDHYGAGAIQAAVDWFKTNGDTNGGHFIDIYSGTYTETVLIDGLTSGVANNLNGVAGNPMTLRPVEANVVIDANEAGAGIYLKKALYWTIGSDDYQLKIIKGYENDAEPGCPGNGDPDTTNCSYTQGGGILVRSKGYHLINNVWITQTKTMYGVLEQSGSQDYAVADINVRFGKRVVIRDSIMDSPLADYNVAFAGGDDHEVHGSTLKNGLRFAWVSVGSWRSIFMNNYVNCVVSEDPLAGDTGGGAFCTEVRETTGSVIAYNIIKSDVSGNDGRETSLLLYDSGPVSGDQPNEQHWVYNNVIIGGRYSAFKISHQVSNCHMFNNIFVNHDSEKCVQFSTQRPAGEAIFGHEFDNNIYECNTAEESVYGQALSSFRTYGSNNITAAADFLASGNVPSPYYQADDGNANMVDAGQNIDTFNGTDYDGNEVPYNGTTDIGAFEFGGSALCTITTGVSPGTQPPSGTVGVPYSEAIMQSNCDSPLTWTIDSGSLPTGLSIGSSTGVISGTPTVAESQTFTVKVVDTDTDNDTQQLTIQIDPVGEGTGYTSGGVRHHFRGCTSTNY